MWPFRVSATPQMRVLVALRRGRAGRTGNRSPQRCRRLEEARRLDLGRPRARVGEGRCLERRRRCERGRLDSGCDRRRCRRFLGASSGFGRSRHLDSGRRCNRRRRRFFGRDRVHSCRLDHGSGRHDEGRQGVRSRLRPQRKAAVSTGKAHADTKVSTPTKSAGTAVHAASVGASNEGSPAVALPPRAAGAAKPVRPQAVGRPAARRTRPAAAVPTLIPPVTAVPRNTVDAGRTGSTPPPEFIGVLAGSSRPDAEHAPDAAPGASVTAATWHRPVATPGTGGASGASGSGLSTAGFFAILTAFLMLAAPIVGRWLRPSIGLALQPACASLPERPG